jgi:hypothetical protein
MVAALAQTMDQAGKLDVPDRPLALATGTAGDVWLCHPFLVHAAQPHHGSSPRFMASHRCIPPDRWTSTAPMAPTARSSGPSAAGSTWTTRTPEGAASSANPPPKAPRNTFRNPALAGLPEVVGQRDAVKVNRSCRRGE